MAHPANNNEGHMVFSFFSQIWQNPVLRFLSLIIVPPAELLGYPIPLTD